MFSQCPLVNKENVYYNFRASLNGYFVIANMHDLSHTVARATGLKFVNNKGQCLALVVRT